MLFFLFGSLFWRRLVIFQKVVQVVVLEGFGHSSQSAFSSSSFEIFDIFALAQNFGGGVEKSADNSLSLFNFNEFFEVPSELFGNVNLIMHIFHVNEIAFQNFVEHV